MADPFVNPHSAHYSKCRRADLELMLELIPAAYPLTASKARPCVAVRMAHYLEHVDALGSFPDLTVLEALKQRAEASTWSEENAKAFLPWRAAKKKKKTLAEIPRIAMVSSAFRKTADKPKKRREIWLAGHGKRW